MTFDYRTCLYTVSLFGILCAGPAQARTISTLEQQGLTNGLSFVDNESPSSFYLHMPADMALANARLTLHLAIAPMLGQNSVLQIFINNIPRTQIAIGDLSDANTDRTVTLPLNAGDLASRYLEVRAQPFFTDKNATHAHGYVRILPDSGISFDDTDLSVRSIRSFLSILGPTVRVRIPPNVSTGQEFGSILAVASYLQSQGRQIAWNTQDSDPDAPADIVLAPQAAQTQGGTSPQTMRLVPAQAGVPAHLFIPMAVPQTLIFPPWTDLLASTAYAQSSTPPHSSPPAAQVISLAAMGATANPVALVTRASWLFTLPPDRVRQLAPSHIHLNMVVPPATPDNPLLLHVFDNGELRNIVALPQRGGPVSVDLPLFETGNAVTDNIRLDLLRQNGPASQNTPTPSYAQILPSSTLTLSPITTPADTLNAITRTFSAATPVYLPADALQHPDVWMATLSGIVNTLHLNPYNLPIHADTSAPDTKQPFIWLRDNPPAGFSAPISFNHGRLRIVQNNGVVLLDAPPLPDIELAAILRNGPNRGLWIKPTADTPPIRPLGFDTVAGDLVFMDRAGQITALDTRVLPVVNEAPPVSYPDSQTWLDRVQNARLWILGVGLFALTLIFLAIIDKIRPQRPGKTHDS